MSAQFKKLYYGLFPAWGQVSDIEIKMSKEFWQILPIPKELLLKIL